MNTIKLANSTDSKRVWEIRNSPESRAVSGSKEAISFEKHDPWFQGKYFSSDTHCLKLLYLY